MNPSRRKLASSCLCLEGVVVGASFFRPFAQRQPGIAFCNPAIAHVLGARHPSAIFRRVRTIVVNAINLMMRTWARPHVSKKCLKGTFPPFANSNSAPAVIRVGPDFWICAPRTHRCPCMPLWSSIHPVLYGSRRGYIFRKTPARSSHPRLQA